MIFRFYEWLFAVVLLFSSMHVFMGLTHPQQAEDPQDVASTAVHMSAVVGEAGIDAAGALLILLRLKRVLRAARAAWPLLALAGLAALSAAWSTDPAITLRRSLLLFISTLFAIYLGERYSIDKFARLLAQAMCLMIAAVYAFYFFAPAYVIASGDDNGAWKGLSAYKNSFGEFMAVAVILLLLVRFRRFGWLRYVFIASAALLLVLSRSAGALACCALTLALMPFWKWARLNRRQRLLVCTISLIVLSAATYFAISHAGSLLHALGRDATLTGRRQLWTAVWPAILKQPMLGYGYDTFWIGLKGEVLNARIAIGWLAPAADNGYIDLCLGLGVVGAAAFLYIFAFAFRKAVRYIRLEQSPIGLWPVSYLCFYLAHNVVESGILTRGAFPSLMFAIIVASLAVSRQRAANASLAFDAQQQTAWRASHSLTLAPDSLRSLR